ncbi:MAG: hypothetical protein V1854_01450 [Methanobacteriota archaeon]
MTRFAIDTCSLIALYYSGYLGDTIKALNLVITNKIHYELEEMRNRRTWKNNLKNIAGIQFFK